MTIILVGCAACGGRDGDDAVGPDGASVADSQGAANDSAARGEGSADGQASADAVASGSTTDASGDGALGDSDLDAGTFACGDASCTPDQICLYPPCGCAAGSSSTCPPPSCVTPADGAGTYDCSGGRPGSPCSAVNAPIPASCSRICQENCA